MKRFIILMVLIVALAFPVSTLAQTATATSTIEGDAPSAESTNNNTIMIGGSVGGDTTSKSSLRVNSQLQPMSAPLTITPDYNGPVFEDHKYQKHILEFIMNRDGLKPFVVKEHGLFTSKSAHSRSAMLSVKEYTETRVVYVFRNMAELKTYVSNMAMVGFTDTFSKGKETLMDCFDQSVIDAGIQGGNIMVLMDVDYIAALGSTTVGLGGSGAAGFLKGATQSSVGGAAVGYAKSKAVPETNPFIHGMVFYSAELPAQPEIKEKSKPVDRFAPGYR